MDPHTLTLMYARNFAFMFYGFAVAWVIVAIYVISLAQRSTRLRKELDDVRRLVASEADEQGFRG